MAKAKIKVEVKDLDSVKSLINVCKELTKSTEYYNYCEEDIIGYDEYDEMMKPIWQNFDKTLKTLIEGD